MFLTIHSVKDTDMEFPFLMTPGILLIHGIFYMSQIGLVMGSITYLTEISRVEEVNGRSLVG